MNRLSTSDSLAFVLAFVLMINSGCATAPSTHMAKINDVPDSEVAKSLVAAVHATPGTTLTTGASESSSLSASDPLVMLESNGKRFRSNYKIYSFEANQGDVYTIGFTSIGHATGFRKTMMIELIYILDESGNVINQSPKSIEQRNPTWTLPFHSYGIWQGTIPQKGLYHVVVAADNSQNGELVRKGVGGSLGGVASDLGAASYPVYSTPFAKFKIELQLK
jgi:hypothetical protein